MTALVIGALAVCAGVVLAASESPGTRDTTRIDKVSVVLIATVAATGAVHAVRVLVLG
jgi:hypothetical protein